MSLQALSCVLPRWLTLCSLASFAAFSPGCASESSEAPAPSPECVVATWGQGESLTLADVDRLRASVSPSPKGPAATRWAVDVHLAAWARGKQDRTPGALVNEYRAWLTGDVTASDGPPDPGQLRRAAAELRQRAQLAPGPCFESAEP